MNAKNYLLIVISILLLTDLAILLNIPFIRQILVFLFLSILPGLLILQILKLNKICFLEKFILSWGLSISFLMLFGFLIDKLYFSLGYATPLSTISLVVSFSAAMIILCVIGYKTKTFEKSFNKTDFLEKELVKPLITSRLDSEKGLTQLKNYLPKFNLNASEKAFLIVPILFPALSIFGMHVMNTTDNNAALLVLLFSIPIYVTFVCFFNHKVSERLYPVVIFLISISLLLLVSLRSNYIIGFDAHGEYDIFQKTLSNLHWSIFGTSALNACLSISLLPSIYQSFLNVNTIYFHKIFYSLLFSVTPLIVFAISKKYVAGLYAFLASIFFMSQRIFLYTAYSPRTNTAILFFALAIMVFLSDGIGEVKKRILFIVFMASCIVSHYSTTYIFFFIMLFCWLSIETLSKFSKKTAFKKSVSLTMVLLFFGIIFFWYSQVTEAAFNAGLNFVEQTFMNLHNFFIMESRGERTETILGTGIMCRQAPFKIEFVFTWLTFALIGIGVISMLKKNKEMVAIPGIKLKHLKPDFLKTKFSIEYLMLTLACAGILVIMVALPYVSQGYDLQRLYSQMAVVLSVVFVFGGIMLSKYFFFLQKTLLLRKSLYGKIASQKTCAKTFLQAKTFNKNISSFGKAFLSKKRFVLKEKQKSLIKKQKEGKKDEIRKGKGNRKNVGVKNGSEVPAYFIILLVLIPYFLCVTGPMYWMFGVPREMTINSDGYQYGSLYIHDQEWYAGEWMGRCVMHNFIIYTDAFGGIMLANHNIPLRVSTSLLEQHKKIEGYVHLRYYNVVNKKLQGWSMMEYNLTEYSDVFAEKNRIYDNGGSEVLR